MSGSLSRVFREGEAAPGSSGTLFGDVFNFSFASLPFALNDRGEVAFYNELTGPGVTAENDGSLWLADATGALTLVVREGSPFEVAPGDTRIVSGIFFAAGSGDEDGFPSGLNDQGQIAFLSAFTDGSSGVFIAVPEPGSWMLLALGAAGLTARACRRCRGGN